MADVMRVRIKSHGPSWYQVAIEDVETGKILPVSWGGTDVMTLRTHQGMIALDVTLLIDEIDLQADAFVVKLVQTFGRRPVPDVRKIHPDVDKE